MGRLGELGRSFSLLAFVVLVGGVRGEEPKSEKVIPAVEARDHIGEAVVVEMTVQTSKNAAPRREIYLDSELDFHDEKNLAVVISYDHLNAFQQAGINDPAEHYRSKRIRVRGTLIREQEQVRIRVEDPGRIVLVKEG